MLWVASKPLHSSQQPSPPHSPSSPPPSTAAGFTLSRAATITHILPLPHNTSANHKRKAGTSKPKTLPTSRNPPTSYVQGPSLRTFEGQRTDSFTIPYPPQTFMTQNQPEWSFTCPSTTCSTESFIFSSCTTNERQPSSVKQASLSEELGYCSSQLNNGHQVKEGKSDNLPSWCPTAAQRIFAAQLSAGKEPRGFGDRKRGSIVFSAIQV